MRDDATPREVVLTIDEHPMVPEGGYVRITSQLPDWCGLARGAVRPGDRVHLFVPEDHFRRHAEELISYKGHLTVIAEDVSLSQLLAIRADLLRCDADYLFTPETAGDGTAPILVASLNVPVKLSFSEGWSEKVLREVLDYFLCCPSLVVSIEPFYALADAIARQVGGATHEYFGEVLGRHYFIDRDQKVSLSRRWAERGEYFGLLNEDGDGWVDSALWTRLQDQDAQTFISRSRCAYCEHYRYCRGFWVTVRDSENCCRVWGGLMDEVADAHREEVVEAQEQNRA